MKQWDLVYDIFGHPIWVDFRNNKISLEQPIERSINYNDNIGTTIYGNNNVPTKRDEQEFERHQ